MDTPRGRVTSSWRRVGKVLELTVEIPGNTAGEVDVPVADGGSMRVLGAGAKYQRTDGGYAIYTVAAGRHTFLASQ